MTKRTTGQLISLAYVLHGAAESFAKPDVGTYKLRRQADRVMRNYINAIGSIGGLILVDRDGHREVCDAAKRQALREAVAWERECIDTWEYGTALKMQALDEQVASMRAARAEVDRLIANEGAAN